MKGAVCAPIKDLPRAESAAGQVEGGPEARAGSSHAWNGCGQFFFPVGEQLCLSSI